MMVRQTCHPAIRAAARLSPILPGSRLSLAAPWTSESKDLVKIGHAARVDNSRMPLPKELIANLGRNEVVRVGKSGPVHRP
jgi:hypothetical protein